jgi:ACS family allantoate permease-like MFS transporter
MMGVKGYDWRGYQAWHAVKDIKTWLLLTFVLFIQLPNGGLTNFGTLVVAGFGFSNFQTLLILLPASVVSAGSMIVWGYFSMKHGNLRTWGMIIPLLPAIVGMAALLGTSGASANRYGRVVAFWLVNSYAVTVSSPPKSRDTGTLTMIIAVAILPHNGRPEYSWPYQACSYTNHALSSLRSG